MTNISPVDKSLRSKRNSIQASEVCETIHKDLTIRRESRKPRSPREIPERPVLMERIQFPEAHDRQVQKWEKSERLIE